MYLPKEAYIRINYVEIDEKTGDEVLHCFGEIQKIALAKYVDSA